MRLWKGAFLVALSIGAASAARADTVLAARMIRAREVIGPEDVTVSPGDRPGMASDPAELIGQEARAMLYPGRPIPLDRVGAPAVVERNDLVPLIYAQGGLWIETEARSLQRAAIGESIRVQNLGSKKTVTGTVRPDGSVVVGGM